MVVVMFIYEEKVKGRIAFEKDPKAKLTFSHSNSFLR